MLKKQNDSFVHVDNAIKKIKTEIKTKDLYFKLYGVHGSKNQIQALSNRLNINRSNPGIDLIVLCIKNLPNLHDLTLSDFFKIENYNTEISTEKNKL